MMRKQSRPDRDYRTTLLTPLRQLHQGFFRFFSSSQLVFWIRKRGHNGGRGHLVAFFYQSSVVRGQHGEQSGEVCCPVKPHPNSYTAFVRLGMRIPKQWLPLKYHCSGRKGSIRRDKRPGLVDHLWHGPAGSGCHAPEETQQTNPTLCNNKRENTLKQGPIHLVSPHAERPSITDVTGIQPPNPFRSGDGEASKDQLLHHHDILDAGALNKNRVDAGNPMERRCCPTPPSSPSRTASASSYNIQIGGVRNWASRIASPTNASIPSSHTTIPSSHAAQTQAQTQTQPRYGTLNTSIRPSQR
ncbi:uncharacterized protein B0H64DRAFT_151792 [Chaetomium fimeti]|uniref:Uncharacterized protein n=1 Tax=Chaetomium fimeti TaxID=1854472 RepID=A0AAE0LSY4_9PEZI|nr:hypothetical protein B0H64DRAFT_151792 [Chaetomium fimeti]